MKDTLTRQQRADRIMDWFAEHHPGAATELHYTNAYELLVAVILSAQCTDKRVNQVTPALFVRFPDIFALSRATSDEIFPFIRSISYPSSKSKHLEGMARKVVNTFNGEIPETVESLQTLPGVGRKTANVVASVIFDVPSMPVDTHVFRVSARLGLTRAAKSPLAAEQQLLRLIPRERLSVAHHWLILHGRYVCKARKPDCPGCGLRQWCSYRLKTKEKVS